MIRSSKSAILKGTRPVAVALVFALGAPTLSHAAPLGVAAPLVAQQAQLPVIDALRAEGYRVTSVKKTLLGRIRVLIQNKNHIREVVVSPSTGEVKSDQVVKIIVTDANGNQVAVSPGRAERGSVGETISALRREANGSTDRGSNGSSNSGGNGGGGGNGNGNGGGNGNGNGGGNGN